MIRKDFSIKKPIEDYGSFIEKFLNDVSKDALKSKSGSYVGDGTTTKTISIGFNPSLLIISENIDLAKAIFPVSSSFVFSLSSNSGVSYIPGVGFVNDAITGYDNSNGNISLGLNSSVNSAGKNYLFLAIG